MKKPDMFGWIQKIYEWVFATYVLAKSIQIQLDHIESKIDTLISGDVAAIEQMRLKLKESADKLNAAVTAQKES